MWQVNRRGTSVEPWQHFIYNSFTLPFELKSHFVSFDNPIHKRRCAEENPAEVMKGLP
jgi:hypothetical protein